MDLKIEKQWRKAGSLKKYFFFNCKLLARVTEGKKKKERKRAVITNIRNEMGYCY